MVSLVCAVEGSIGEARYSLGGYNKIFPVPLRGETIHLIGFEQAVVGCEPDL